MRLTFSGGQPHWYRLAKRLLHPEPWRDRLRASRFRRRRSLLRTRPYDTSNYPTSSGLSKPNSTVKLGDSIIYRLILLLDYLSQNSDHGDYWSSFLINDSHSPYFSPHDSSGALNYTRRVSPDWSRIVFAGHSQGAAMAAFIGITTPVAVRRVVMLSGPQDNYERPIPDAAPEKTSANWIATSSTTPMNRFWGVDERSGSVFA